MIDGGECRAGLEIATCHRTLVLATRLGVRHSLQRTGEIADAVVVV